MGGANSFAVDADVVILRTITKKDVVDFYDRFIDLESPFRSKASVQMHAASVSADDRKSTLTEALVQFLSAAAGVVSNAAEVEQALDSVDIHNNDAIVAAVKTYLEEVKKIDVEVIDGILDTGRKALEEAMPAKMDDDMKLTPGVRGEVVVESLEEVMAWKAGCMVSAGPRPVKPLVEFEKTEVKL